MVLWVGTDIITLQCDFVQAISTGPGKQSGSDSPAGLFGAHPKSSTRNRTEHIWVHLASLGFNTRTMQAAHLSLEKALVMPLVETVNNEGRRKAVSGPISRQHIFDPGAMPHGATVMRPMK